MTSDPARQPAAGSRGVLAALAGWGGMDRFARHSFRFEFLAVASFSILAVAVQPQFAQLIAQRTFAAPDWIIAALAASGPLGFLVAGLCSAAIARARKVRLIVTCLLVTAVAIPAAGALTPGGASAHAFAAILFSVAILEAVRINAQSGLWQANYPAARRGRTIGRLMTAGMALMAGLTYLLSELLERHERFYRLMFLVAGAGALATAALYSRIRVRGERARRNRSPGRRISLNPLGALSVLRRDKSFRRYMSWQMLLGSSSMAIESIIVIILGDRFAFGYVQSGLILVIVTMAARLVCVPVLSHVFDRINFFTFRGAGALGWSASRAVLFIGVATLNVPLVVVSRLLTGLAGSFGQLAWNLGHMKFSNAEDGPLYMGAHLLMTSLRGITVPLIAFWLYRDSGLGIHLIWLSGLGHLAAAIGFRRLRRQMPPPVSPTVPTP